MDSEHIIFEFTGTVFSQGTNEIFAIILQITVAYIKRWDLFIAL